MKLLSLIPLCALAACSFGQHGRLQSLQPGMSQQDVVQRLGEPKRIVSHADGGRSLEYSDAPIGDQCYMVRLDAAGKLVSARDMFWNEQFPDLKQQMTKQEVSELMCQPISVTLARTGEEAWEWNARNPGIRDGLRLVAYFRGNRLTRTERITVIKDDG